MANEKFPTITDHNQLEIWDAIASKTGARSTKWFYFTADDEAYVGESNKERANLSLADFSAGLERVPDDIIYPTIPAGTHITIAPENMVDGAVFIKRMAFNRVKSCSSKIGLLKEEGLSEVLAIEKVSQMSHPYIVQYHGCRVHRGRITGMVLERLRYSLNDYAHHQEDGGSDSDDDSDDDSDNDDGVPRTKLHQIDKEAFLAGVESAIKFLHSIGLAHNDISPANIMVREADDGSYTPALVDFGSCMPFGMHLYGRGTPGFMDKEDEDLLISRARHDEFALQRLSEWWHKDHRKERLRLLDELSAKWPKANQKQQVTDLEGVENGEGVKGAEGPNPELEC
ncbi:kinase-like domain-containing protein [Chaetomium tenue]|uniref:Kinase-like domain-containing protein n=1 Tax=Chaetomium tenue TaxID=1854479 RepID=A0ACB7P782_9PEZI|nr:kinase-like domain-containing protein [Chaetomium globosum]